jgi:hypothetical protein
MRSGETLLNEVMPIFYAEVQAALEQRGLSELMAQLPSLQIVSRCGCGDKDCATFYVRGPRDLNVVERSIIAVRRGVDSVSLEITGLLGIDIDNFGRIGTFEVWGRADIAESLKAGGIPTSKA